MKLLIQTVLVILLTTVAEILLPWWSLIIACFLVAFFFYNSRFSSFLSGFLGVGFLWFWYALLIDIDSNSILTTKVAQIFKLPTSVLFISDAFLLILFSSLVGAITGGFASLSGHLFREFFTRKEYKD